MIWHCHILSTGRAKGVLGLVGCLEVKVSYWNSPSSSATCVSTFPQKLPKGCASCWQPHDFGESLLCLFSAFYIRSEIFLH